MHKNDLRPLRRARWLSSATRSRWEPTIETGRPNNRAAANALVESSPDSTRAAHVAAGAAAAMAAAVRRQLTTPGSVPPGEQLLLMLADRDAHYLCGTATSVGSRSGVFADIPGAMGDLRVRPAGNREK